MFIYNGKATSDNPTPKTPKKFKVSIEDVLVSEEIIDDSLIEYTSLVSLEEEISSLLFSDGSIEELGSLLVIAWLDSEDIGALELDELECWPSKG